jgi:CubicO group peptidase (beta-lactamase class C family)
MFTLLMIVGSAGTTTVLVVLFGWVEDRANRRPARLWPLATHHHQVPTRERRLPRLAQAGAAVGVSLFTLAATATVSSAVVRIRAPRSGSNGSSSNGSSSSLASRKLGLRVPSQQPKAPTIKPATTSGSKPSTRSAADVEHEMQTAIESWMKVNNVPGAEIAVYRPGSFDWARGFGVDTTTENQPLADTRFDIASITKTFTATLVWQLVDRGVISLDAPLPKLDAVPDFPYSYELTVRELLTHRSGLTNYRDTKEYRANPNAVITPEQAITFTGHEALVFSPDSKSVYSSVNYLVLGLLLEQVTGRSYDSLLDDLVSASGVGPIGHTGPEPGEPNFAAAGMTPTATQLTHWAVALLRDDVPGLSSEARDAMAHIDPDSALGAGLWGYCPCTSDAGHTQFAALGHSGAGTELQYSSDPDLAIAINLTDSIWVPDNRQDQLTKLFSQLRELAAEARPQ